MTHAQWEQQRRVAESDGRWCMRNELPASANPYRPAGDSREFWRCWDNGWRDETWVQRT